MDFYAFIRDAVIAGASDIHCAAGNKPALRIHGKICFPEDHPLLTDEEVLDCIRQVLSSAHYARFQEAGDIDAAANIKDFGRFRINAFHQRNGAALVMRVVHAQPPEINTLNLPASIGKILNLQEGLVLATGPAGSGKTTTLAALIHEMNKKRCLHIVTIEDPVEYIHTPIRCIINQREVGTDSLSYSTALRAVLRENPDVILIGEIRDPESMTMALSAAETGHLVFSTLHTEGAAKTIDRMIDLFPESRQQQVLGQLSTTLKAVVSQRLLPRADIPGQIGAFEMMFVNPAVANLIRENKTAQIDQIIQLNKNAGMLTRNASIQLLLENGYITPETARRYSLHTDSPSAAGMPPYPNISLYPEQR